MPFKVIVVGTDGSNRAGAAVDEALSLAQMSEGAVHAVHSVHPGVEAGFADSHGSQLAVKEMRDHAQRVKDKVQAQADAAGVSLEFHILGKNDPADAILEVAETVGADLVVVGNKGMTGMKRFVLGSVPNKISHKCPCSVMIVNTSQD